MGKCCGWWIKYVEYLEGLEDSSVGGEYGLGIYQDIINEVISNYCPVCGKRIEKHE